MFPPCLLVVHDTSGCGENNVTELTRGQQLDYPLLQISELDVVTRRDDPGLVQSGHLVSAGKANLE